MFAMKMFMFLLQTIVENPMMATAICIIPADASKIFTACSHVHYQVSSPLAFSI